MEIGSKRLTKNKLREMSKADADEMIEVVKGYSDMIENDLKRSMNYITRFCDEDTMYELGAIIESLRENVEFLSSESYFIAFKLGREIKKNGLLASAIKK